MAASRRLFFALWPPAEVAAALHIAAREAHKRCGGRPMQRDTLHLTMAFLGEVEDAQFDAACEAASAATEKVGAGGTATLSLDRLAYWKHNRIVWAGCDAVPEPLAALAKELAAALRERGFRLDSRPFAAHVTLLRNARCGAGELPPLETLRWEVRDFVLVESQLAAAGAHYEIRRRWPLG